MMTLKKLNHRKLRNSILTIETKKQVSIDQHMKTTCEFENMN